MSRNNSISGPVNTVVTAPSSPLHSPDAGVIVHDGQRPRRGFLLGIGATSGFLGSTVGASGPVTSPMLKAVTVSHRAFVATAAATQVVAHFSKLIAFTATGWDVTEHLGVIAVGTLGVIIGSLIGTRLLPKVPAERLDLIFRVVLTALALRLIYNALT